MPPPSVHARQVCQKHNVLILEDDAYFWLQFYAQRGEGQGRAGGEVPGLQLPPSFLSLDTDGRVIRVDTLSKLMGPGWVPQGKMCCGVPPPRVSHLRYCTACT